MINFWKALYVSASILILTIASWFIVAGIFDWKTESGKIYNTAILDRGLESYTETRTIQGLKDYYSITWDAESKHASARVFVEENFIVEIRMQKGSGRILNLFSEPSDEASVDAIFLSYLVNSEFWDSTARLYGEDDRSGIRKILGFSDEPRWTAYENGAIEGWPSKFLSSLGVPREIVLTPNARNVQFDTPLGSLVPLIESIIENSSKAAQATTEERFRNALVEKISDEMIDIFRLNGVEEDLKDIAFLYGPVQFVTLWLFVFTTSLLLLSIWARWAKDSAESTTGLIPYVGFFGTLLGMGGALSVLGKANLSDAASKAVNLGPIGNDLSVAIETTKYALILYGVAVLFLMLRDAVSK